MANGHGGARPNSGPAKGTIYKPTMTKEAARVVAFNKVVANLEPLFDAQVAHAGGIKYLVGREKKTGKFVRLKEDRVQQILDGKDDTYEYLEVWEKDPSVQAFTDLMNRTLDKPTETQHVTISGELALVSERLQNWRKRKAKKA